MSAITLSKVEMADLIKDAKAELVEALITRSHPALTDEPSWDFFLECEICGILKITRRTLLSWEVPRYPLPGGKIVYYRLAEVKAFLISLREK